MRGPQSIVIPPNVEEISTLTPQKMRKTRSQSLVSSPIPQLDGNNKYASSESETEPDPEPETQPNPIFDVEISLDGNLELKFILM